VSVIAQYRMRASGAAIMLGFFVVLIFDLLLTSALVITQGKLDSTIFAGLLMLNPADVFRLLNIFSSQQVQHMYGLATVMPDSCLDSCDYVPIRSWPLFKARHVLSTLHYSNESRPRT
jgi:Cu-processing system permease protein